VGNASMCPEGWLGTFSMTPRVGSSPAITNDSDYLLQLLLANCDGSSTRSSPAIKGRCRRWMVTCLPSGGWRAAGCRCTSTPGLKWQMGNTSMNSAVTATVIVIAVVFVTVTGGLVLQACGLVLGA